MKYILLFTALFAWPQDPSPSVEDIATQICRCGDPIAKVADQDDQKILVSATKEVLHCIGGEETMKNWYRDLSVEQELEKEKQVMARLQTQCPTVAKGLAKVK